MIFPSIVKKVPIFLIVTKSTKIDVFLSTLKFNSELLKTVLVMLAVKGKCTNFTIELVFYLVEPNLTYTNLTKSINLT